MASSHSASASIKALTTSVAQAHPTTPNAGKPRPPNANQIDNGIFTTSDAACSQVTSTGLPSAWFSVP